MADDDSIETAMEYAREMECSLKTARYLIGLEKTLSYAIEHFSQRLTDIERALKRANLGEAPRGSESSALLDDTKTSQAKADVARFMAGWTGKRSK